MRSRGLSGRQSPILSAIAVMWVVQQFFERFAKGDAWPGKYGREFRQGGGTPTLRIGVADVQNHSSGHSHGRFLPVPFLGTVFTRPNDHLRDILRIGNVAVGE